MTIIKATLLAAAASFGLAGAAIAQSTAPAANTPAPAATPKIVAGTAVSDTAGGSVGTIDSVSGNLAVLNTGTNKVSLPMASFAAGPNGGLLISMTKAQVDAAAGNAAQDSAAELAAQITAGAKVSDGKGGPVGTIESNDGQYAVVDTGKNKVKLPLNAFAKGASGPVIGMTASELDAAASKAAPKSGS